MTIVRANSINHQSPVTDEARANTSKLQQYANSLGLHGVLIVSERCASCGNLHSFSLVSDLQGRIDEEADQIVSLLEFFAEVARTTPPVFADEAPVTQ